MDVLEVGLRRLGHTNVSDLFKANPGVPSGVVLRKVRGSDERLKLFPYLFLVVTYEKESTRNGRAREFAIDSLQRSMIEHIGKGWEIGRQWREKKRSNIFVYWHTPEEHSVECDKVMNYFLHGPYQGAGFLSHLKTQSYLRHLALAAAILEPG